MVRVSILYPNTEGGRFDFDYYLATHMPMSIRLLGDAVKKVDIERGVSGPAPGSPAAYLALCHFTCETREAFEAAFFANAATLQGDMPNYTDIEPVIQISEVALTHQPRT